MTTFEFPSKEERPCEQRENDCDFCVSLSRQALLQTLEMNDVHPNTARNIAGYTPVHTSVNKRTETLGRPCDVRRERAVKIGCDAAETRLESLGIVIGGERAVSRLDTTPVEKLQQDSERWEYFESLASDFTPLTRERLLETADEHSQDITSVMEAIDALGWPSDQDRTKFSWRHDRIFARGKYATENFAHFATGEGRDGPNNLVGRFQSRYKTSDLPYVQRARLIAPDLYEALREVFREEQGTGSETIFDVIRHDPETAEVLLQAYRRMYMLFGRLMRYEDIYSPEKDVGWELWT